MGKTYLSREELKQFPTLQKLIDESEGHDRNFWGMCINNNREVSFGAASSQWKLLFSLEDLFNCANPQLSSGIYNAENIILFYAFDLLDNGIFYFSFLETDPDTGVLSKEPCIEWNYPEMAPHQNNT